MAKIYKVKNINEALNLAKEFKATSKYTLFRGQAQNWDVVPTAGRLSESDYEKTKEKVERLYYYFLTTKSLKKYSSNIDTFFSIAQHYGVPTHYIDFTSSIEVAFYFATNSTSTKLSENCAIICLNENDFEEFIKFTKVLHDRNNVVAPFILKHNIENLWRLQSQKGSFLFTPYPNIELLYKFDRILFPFETPFKDIKEKDIYPVRKSELEIMLDHYFAAEIQIDGEERLKLFSEMINIPITTLPPVNQFKILQKKEVHKSWYSKTYRKWHFPLKEDWQSSGSEKKITLNLNFDQSQFINSSIFFIRKEFTSKNIERKTPLKFQIHSHSKLSKKLKFIIYRSCTRIWDGLRNLPYTNDEIFFIISKYLFLELFCNAKESIDDLPSFEMSNKYGTRTRFKANPQAIAESFRSDIDEIILSEMARPIPCELLLHISKPRYIFDFFKLIELFKQEIVAYQVLANRENDNPAIFYTPTQISIFGYA